jgi:predicted TPR repeat methyltransferase
MTAGAAASDPFLSGSATATAHVETARQHSALGETETALRECEAALADGGLSLKDAVEIVHTLRECGQTARAENLERETLARIEAVLAREPQNAGNLVMAAQLALWLERFDLAEIHVRRAVALAPRDLRAALILADICIRRDDPEAASAAWQPLFDALPKAGDMRLRAATQLAHFGYREQAERMLQLAEPLCLDRKNEFAHVAAGIRGRDADLPQSAFAVELFNRFSAVYDANLQVLGNSGPQMIAAVLDKLGLARDGSRAVLDAGCGTGLCAPYLRPYARLLHGADISVGMLEQAKRKSVYDLLTRTDMSVRATFPEGMFDLMVSSDVLVYFGDLTEVLRNMAAKLHAGGWLVVTVEDAGTRAAKRGHLLQPSGRHAHRLDYLQRALTASGFGRPKVTLHGTLRHEFARPVPGIAVAAQRLALFAP